MAVLQIIVFMYSRRQKYTIYLEQAILNYDFRLVKNK